MAEDEGKGGGAEAGAAKPKGGKRRLLLIGAALMALSGAGAFAAVSMLSPEEAESPEAAPAPDEAHAAEAAADAGHGDAHALASAVAFVPVDPLMVTLDGGGAGRTHLRFAAQLEVPVARAEEVARLMPRIVDVMGGYLRALEPELVADRDAHLRLRAQMLRRVRLVVGAEAVHDLLVMEFVIN